MAALERFTGCWVGLVLGDAIALATPDTPGAPVVTDQLVPTDRTRQALQVARVCISHEPAEPDPTLLRRLAGVALTDWYHADGVGDGDPEPATLNAARALMAGAHAESRHDNNSDGGDALLRAIPLGLVFPPAQAVAAARVLIPLTHGHPTAVAASAALAWVVSHVARGAWLQPAWLEEAPGADGAIANTLRRALSGVEAAPGGAVSVLSGVLTALAGLPVASPEAWGQAVSEAGRLPDDEGRVSAVLGALLGLSWGAAALDGALLTHLQTDDDLEDWARALHRAARGVPGGKGPMEL